MSYRIQNVLVLLLISLIAFIATAQGAAVTNTAAVLKASDIKGYNPARFHALIIAIDKYRAKPDAVWPEGKLLTVFIST